MPKVHIRKKKISKDRQSFYLDFSPPLTNPQTGKPQRYEFLGLFTYDKPTGVWERKHNTETNELVESIRATRQLDIQNRKFGFMADRTREQSFIVYYTDYIRSKGSLSNDNLSMSLRYFTTFAGHDINFFDVDGFLISDYRNYLLRKDLFSSYYQELWSIKTAIAYYSRLSDLTQKQVALVSSYNQAWGLIKNDKHFSADELTYMGNVYSGILQESIKDLDQILAVVHANKTQMPDAKRLELVNKAADHMDSNYNDLQEFTTQNEMLSIQRAEDENEALTLKQYYGID